MRKTSAILASGFGTDDFDKDLNISLSAIYDSDDAKIIDMKYQCMQLDERLHFSALIIYECEEEDG